MKNIFTIFFILLFGVAFSQVDTLNLDEQNKIILNKKIKENSGIQYVNGFLYAFNDSGGKPEVYKITTEGKIVQTIKLDGAKNVDWESISAKGDTIFIAETGNNFGNRKDLKIYYFKLGNSKADSIKVKPNQIKFSFENQKDFSKKKNMNTDFDCESILYYKGKFVYKTVDKQ